MPSDSETHTPPHGLKLRSSRGGTRLLLVGMSLVLAYGVAFLTSIIRWMNFWMRGPYFVPYQAVFLSALMIFLLWWSRRHHNGPPPVLSTVIYSIAAGYTAGVIAMALYPIFQPDGLQQVLSALQFPTLEATIAFFWFPVRLLTWLFGGIAGVMLVVISRRPSVLERRPS